MSPERRDAIAAFLTRAGWGAAQISPLPGDASTRHYARLDLNGRRAMLMDQPQKAEAPVAPLGAGPEERKALGYNAVARLAGADCGRFVGIANYLRGLGFSAPEILDADPAQGLVLLEDLGDALYADVLGAEQDEIAPYEAAAHLLAELHVRQATSQLGDLPLFDYDETALLAEVDLLTEWFFPLALGRAASDGEIAEHRALWRAALAPLLRAPAFFVHRDYHAQNLLWLPQRAGTARIGLIDFQDAVRGSRAYDLASLIEDARRDVSPALAAAAIDAYLSRSHALGTAPDESEFRAELAIMAAQRNAKIVGIFARLHRRDGKSRYLSYLPRVWNHLENDLRHPALAQLRDWYDREIPRAARSLLQAAAP
jgi:hypothetical protein